jgi:hypothetical protein
LQYDFHHLLRSFIINREAPRAASAVCCGSDKSKPNAEATAKKPNHVVFSLNQRVIQVFISYTFNYICVVDGTAVGVLVANVVVVLVSVETEEVKDAAESVNDPAVSTKALAAYVSDIPPTVYVPSKDPSDGSFHTFIPEYPLV